jgi:hypothetical protein
LSFDSDLEIAIIGFAKPDLEPLKQDILRQLNRDGIHHDVYEDLMAAFRDGRGHFRVHAAYLVDLLDKIAPMIPAVSFHARGLGEDFRHTWVAEYKEGKRIYSQGPWDYE